MAKRLRPSPEEPCSGDTVHEGLYEQLTHPPDQDGFLSLPVDICRLTNKASDILVRDSYKRLLRQAMRRKLAFVHLSGNPGTGKSCCIWYFVHALLCNEKLRSSYIVVQLVVVDDVTFLIVSPEKVIWSTRTIPRAVLRIPGTWLLADQRFTGARTTLSGKTILFASPARASGAAAAENAMDELLFGTLYLDAWTPSELLKVFNRRFMKGKEPLARTAYDTSQRYPSGSFNCRVHDGGHGYSAAAHFLARLYVCGGIVRSFFEPLDTVMHRQMGNEQGEVFYNQPDYPLQRIEEIELVSSYVRKVWRASLGIPETIALPPMSGDGVTKLSLVCEQGPGEILSKMEDFLLKQQPLFDEEGGHVCGQCGGP